MGLKSWIDGMGRGLRAFTRRMADDARGNVAMLFGLCVPVLVLMTVGGVDIHRASTVRVNLQDALDAAALSAARSPYTANADLQRVGLASLRANLQAYPNIILREADTTFVLNADDVVIANSKVDVKTLVANLFLPPYGKFMDDYLPVGAHSEVDRSSRNIEVALVLDTTGSMAGQKIIDLRAAAKDLVDIVVQDIQTPWYSRVAIVPYSMAVNVDSYANAARGSIVGSVNITGAVINLAGTPKTITAATQARPVVVTSNAHGFSNNDVVWISGVGGMTALNNKPYLVKNKTDNTFQLYRLNGYAVDGRYYNAFSGTSGRVQRCQNNDCSITITANNHGLVNNNYVYITDIGGMTQINNETYLVGNATTNTFTIDMNETTLTPYTSGGRSWCAQQGCTYYAFENVYDDLTTHRISTCVTERTGDDAYTDTAPSTARVGRNYPSTSNPCLSNTLRPLSSDRSSVKADIDRLSASGSTGGHIGVAWGWYAVSPNFSGLFGSSAGGAYNTAETLKAVVIMTDGEYNSGYCNGVISADSTNGSGAASLHINCNAPNGHPFDQTLALCTAMKNAGVIVYTVGFQVVDDDRARALVNNCATNSGNVYMADSGTDLREAFSAIGRDITQLRISR
ncbi:TadE/TadG family type IV pilus assembly protein [Brevundimonas sp.]|uniref:TadE/TadG family type IV pilus assembly protein n=1 Tax=Brevundimonas sp. TaxID=1871086 RepID=UPI0027379BB0|nr:TadE/TadG family type IV pilus assembly protein [Brevundimonas sp.]MDP3803703.1 ubiquitin-activating E1 FCCH domain-containing protein [Brevundimonas sp.]MDZ4364506.1 ubiquitin-activating E1 FCCH domain-containing protein [Brevundimonas sp.]